MAKPNEGVDMSEKGLKAEERLALQKKQRKKKIIFFTVVAVILIVLAAALIYVYTREEPPKDPNVYQESKLDLPISELADNYVHAYIYKYGSKQIKYFVMNGSTDHKVHACFNACVKHYKEGLGFEPAGDNLQCRSQLCSYPISDIGTGKVLYCGCGPFSLPFNETGGNVIIKATDLQAGAKYF